MDTRHIDIRDYLKVLAKRRVIAIAGFVITAVIVLTVIMIATPLYRATTEVIIEKSEQNILPNSTYFMPYDPDFYTTQHQIITSTAVGRKVVDIARLNENSILLINGGQGFSFRSFLRKLFTFFSTSKPDSTTVTGHTSPDALAEMVSAGLQVTPVPDSHIVHISFTSPSPKLAALIANSAAQAYIDQVLDMKLDASRYTLDWMTKKASEEAAKLEDAAKVLNDYIKANDIITLENRIAVLPDKLKELSSELTSAESHMDQLQAVHEKLAAVTKPEDYELFPPISTNQTFQAVKAQELQAEQNILDLSKQYGEKHPIMISAKAELKAIKDREIEEARKIVQSINNDYELARATVGKLRARLDETKAETLALNEKFSQYETLKKEVQTNQQLYDVLVTKIKEQGIQEQIKGVNVWILKHAKVPQAPFSPNTSRDVPLSLLFSLAVGIGLAFLFEFLDNTIKGQEDAEDRLHAPVLGVVPDIKGEEENIGLLSASDPESRNAEFYKAIRTSILLSSAKSAPKTILVTSAAPKEGKTTSSINLAAAISQYGRTVVLVDADLRKPAIHTALGLQNQTGLSTYLAGGEKPLIHGTEAGLPSNLHVITSGPIPPNPSELLGSDMMGALLDELKDVYDVVVLDSPPVSTMTDSAILSKVVDGTVFITRAGSTTYKAAERGLKSLVAINAHILGIVVNGVSLTRHDYYYGHYYSYGREEKK